MITIREGPAAGLEVLHFRKTAKPVNQQLLLCTFTTGSQALIQNRLNRLCASGNSFTNRGTGGGASLSIPRGLNSSSCEHLEEEQYAGYNQQCVNQITAKVRQHAH